MNWHIFAATIAAGFALWMASDSYFYGLALTFSLQVLGWKE